MNKHTRKAMEMMKAAIPESGFCPESPQEWDRLQLAQEELAYAMYRDKGMSNAQARQLAKQIYGGQAGRLLLEMSFKGNARA